MRKVKNMKYEKLAKTLLASASLAALIAATPFYVDFDSKDGVSLKISQAFASGDDGDSDDGDGDDGDSDDGDDEDSDDGDDEDSDDADENDDGDGDSNEFLLLNGTLIGTKVEISSDGLNIELKYVDGSSEEIQNGVYEKKDISGNTIEERPSTADDVTRLQAIINGG